MQQSDISYHLAMCIYAILFASPAPVAKSDILEKLHLPGDAFIDGLNALEIILQNSSPLRLREFEDKLQLETRPEFADYIVSVTNRQKKKTLSKESLETLSVIAYKQPITKSAVDEVRGVDCDKTLDTLIELGLIRRTGRLDQLGAPILYQTTELFLQVMGLRSLSDLPDIAQSRD